MRTDYFVLMNASGVTSNEKVVTRFRRLRTIEEAEKMYKDELDKIDELIDAFGSTDDVDGLTDEELSELDSCI